MASFDLAEGDAVAPLVDGASLEEEEAYWDMNNEREQQQQQRFGRPPSTDASPTQRTDQGLMSKLSGIEIGTVYDNLSKSLGDRSKALGDQAKTLGDQAKTLGDQAKGYTLANASTATAAISRFKKQIVAAVDGVPLRPDADRLRESGTTTSAETMTTEIDEEESRVSLLPPEQSQEDNEEEKNAGGGQERQQQQQDQSRGAAQEEALRSFSVGCTQTAKRGNKGRGQLNGSMVDESAPVLGLGVLGAVFKKKVAEVEVAAQTAEAVGVESRNAISLDATVPPGSSPGDAAVGAAGDAAAAGGGESQSGRDGGAAALKIIPRSASLVGGRQWAVLASVYDTTASVIDETVSDMFT
ncbi:unnamed protein product [Ectocarpus sp. CCAP 1310/34]|nr:unnamed protein product [Ectocarpus sp. CCAP 1310/34]